MPAPAPYWELLSRLTTALIAIAIFSAPLYSQTIEPGFYAEALARKADQPGSSSLEVNTRVAHSALTFVSTAQGFSANYELTADLYELNARGKRGRLVRSSVWDGAIDNVRSFASTTSTRISAVESHSMGTVVPGTYEVVVSLRDRNADTEAMAVSLVNARSFEAPVTVSDILVLDEEQQGPSVANLLDTQQPRVRLSYEVYSRERTDATFSYEVYRLHPRTLEVRYPDTPELTSESASTSRLGYGTNRVTGEIPLRQLMVGSYKVVVHVKSAQGEILDSAEKVLATRWMGLSDRIASLDQAIDQLTYIAKPRELKSIRGAVSREERLERFNAFWEKRDPTPRTPRNERMEEYYYRIDYADQNFASADPGWLSVRGQTFIKYGEPDRRESSSLGESGRNLFEEWTYEATGKRFLFFDAEGNGDFKIQKPILTTQKRIR